MKTLKITDEAHQKLNYLKWDLKISHHVELKTLSETIDFLWKCWASMTDEQEKELFKNYEK